MTTEVETITTKDPIEKFISKLIGEIELLKYKLAKSRYDNHESKLERRVENEGLLHILTELELICIEKSVTTKEKTWSQDAATIRNILKSIQN